MSKVCFICDKSAARANHVSHSNRKVPRRQHPNLQLTEVEGESVRVCSSCRRTMVKKLA